MNFDIFPNAAIEEWKHNLELSKIFSLTDSLCEVRHFGIPSERNVVFHGNNSTIKNIKWNKVTSCINMHYDTISTSSPGLQ